MEIGSRYQDGAFGAAVRCQQLPADSKHLPTTLQSSESGNERVGVSIHPSINLSLSLYLSRSATVYLNRLISLSINVEGEGGISNRRTGRLWIDPAAIAPT